MRHFNIARKASGSRVVSAGIKAQSWVLVGQGSQLDAAQAHSPALVGFGYYTRAMALIYFTKKFLLPFENAGFAKGQ